MSSTLFNNIASTDFMHLYKGNQLNVKKVVELLNYQNSDVSTAVDVGVKSVRYDEKMPAVIRERATEWATALNLVGEFFQDANKTILWFRTPNPQLANMTPRDMIRVGRFKKLLKFIQTALSENHTNSVVGQEEQKSKAINIISN